MGLMPRLTVILSMVVLTGCAIAQDRIVKNGTGLKTALILENQTVGVNGSCLALRSTDTVTAGPTGVHDAARLCGVFNTATYSAGRATIQTVTGDSAYQTNTTFIDKGQVIGDTVAPTWFTPPDYYSDVVSSGDIAESILDGNTGTDLLFRIGNKSASNKLWSIAVSTVGGQSAQIFRVFDDAHSAQTTWLQVVRSALTISSVTFPETVTTHILQPEANNTYTIGNSSSSYSQIYTVIGNIGRPSSLQGVLNIFNTTNASAVTMAGTNANVGIDVGIGNLIGSASSLYPLNGVVSLGGTSHRWLKMWTTDLDISGTCTGCTAGANQALSNLTNPTAVNQDIIMNGTNIHVQDGSGNQLIELQNGGTNGNILTTTSTGTQLVLLNQFGVDVGTGLSYNVAGLTGMTTTVGVPCGTLTFTGGVLTSKGACP